MNEAWFEQQMEINPEYKEIPEHFLPQKDSNFHNQNPPIFVVLVRFVSNPN